MNHRENISHNKHHLKNMFDKEIVSMEHYIVINLKQKYKLKNRALHEQCLINTLEKLNKLLLLENNKYMNNTEDNYELTLENSYFTEDVVIDEDERTLPIRIKKTDEIINKDIYMLRTVDIVKNNYSGYILYEIIDGDM